MEAQTGASTGYDVAHVAAGLVFVSLAALFLLNRVTFGVTGSVKVG